MKQTAVQWFAARAMYLKMDNQDMHNFLEWFEEAKQMEKEQIENAFDIGLCEGYDYGFTNDSPTKENGEQYYKENYGQI